MGAGLTSLFGVIAHNNKVTATHHPIASLYLTQRKQIGRLDDDKKTT